MAPIKVRRRLSVWGSQVLDEGAEPPGGIGGEFWRLVTMDLPSMAN